MIQADELANGLDFAVPVVVIVIKAHLNDIERRSFDVINSL